MKLFILTSKDGTPVTVKTTEREAQSAVALYEHQKESEVAIKTFDLRVTVWIAKSRRGKILGIFTDHAAASGVLGVVNVVCYRLDEEVPV